MTAVSELDEIAPAVPFADERANQVMPVSWMIGIVRALYRDNKPLFARYMLEASMDYRATVKGQR